MELQLDLIKAKLAALLDVNYCIVIFQWRAVSHEMMEDRILNIHENYYALFGLYIIPFIALMMNIPYYLLCLVWLVNHSF